MDQPVVTTSPTRHFSVQTFIRWILLLTVAGLFLFSGLSKLFALPPFEWAIEDAGVPGGPGMASVLARLLVGTELACGFLILLQFRLRSFTWPLVLGLLGIFSAYLLMLLLRQGNQGDCGCFGNWLSMSPAWALAKNAAMALSVAALWRMSSGVEFRFQKTIALLLVLAASVVPFAFNPADFRPHRLDLNPLYQNAEAPKLDLRKGKHVVAFMSLGCPHCREAARILEQFRTENPRVPLFMVLHGRKVDAPDFFQATGAVQVPHMIYDNTEAFVKMAGPYVPAIYFVHDSRVERSLSYPQLNRVSIEQWASH